MQPHPDRIATTLAQRAFLLAGGPGEREWTLPEPGSADARIDLKLARANALRALSVRGTPAARSRLQGLDTPDLLAGTVQDGTARGLLVAYEEAVSLCAPAPPEPERTPPVLLPPRELRRRREILVASGGARVRFSRRDGIHFVDRAEAVNATHALRFEDARDVGTLDGFAAVEGERARVFDPAHLQPAALAQDAARDLLVLAGRLGRRRTGFACRITLEGRKDEPFLRVTIEVENLHPDHRLRLRLHGVPPELVRGCGTPPFEPVITKQGRHHAATLVRACGRLRVGDALVAVPGAQCPGWIRHGFEIG